jgi:muramoyltetrapeptide carboxypeptidase LdcA involved in peptidoglycan recycling
MAPEERTAMADMAKVQAGQEANISARGKLLAQGAGIGADEAGAREAFAGRLFGGCLDTLVHVAGSVHADGGAFTQRHRNEGVILYLENAEGSPGDVVRAFHRLRWAGWLDGLAGVLLGRSAAPEPAGEHGLRHDDALRQTFGTLPCPVLADVDIGHVPPQMVLVNGAHAQVRWSAEVADVEGRPWGGGDVTQRFD